MRWNHMNAFNGVVQLRKVKQILVVLYKGAELLTSNAVLSFCRGRRGRLRTACLVICKICVNTDVSIETS